MEKPKGLICKSCGVPMQKKEDFGGGDPNNKYCKNCAPDGELMSREKIREGWIGYVMKTENISKEEAETKVNKEMAKMPAWAK